VNRFIASGKGRLNGLDHLRAFAIAYVFLFHYPNLVPHPGWMVPLGRFGWSGVDLFFVLSGYLIGGQLMAAQAAGRKIAVGDFYIKRFFRIVPVYLVVLALYFGVPLFRESDALTPLWKFLTFTQNFLYEVPGGGTFSHAWSLCVEEHFYVVLPALLILLAAFDLRRHAVWIALAVLMGGIGIRAFSWLVLFKGNGNWVEWIYYPTYNRLDGLLVGVFVAGVQQFSPERWLKWTARPGLVLATGVALLVLAMFVGSARASFTGSVFGFPLVSLAYGFIVVAAVSPGAFLDVARSRVTRFVATISYSFYLVHKGVIHLTHLALAGLGFEVDGVLGLVASLLLATLAAWALYRLVERPAMAIRSVVLAKRNAVLLPQTTRSA